MTGGWQPCIFGEYSRLVVQKHIRAPLCHCRIYQVQSLYSFRDSRFIPMTCPEIYNDGIQIKLYPEFHSCDMQVNFVYLWNGAEFFFEKFIHTRLCAVRYLRRYLYIKSLPLAKSEISSNGSAIRLVYSGNASDFFSQESIVPW